MSDLNRSVNTMKELFEKASKCRNADELMEGVSNMWLVRRNMPNRDSIPFMVETLW